MPEAKPKLLIYSDSPEATTGLGRITRYMIQMFSDEYDVTVFGLNHPNWNLRGKKINSAVPQGGYGCQFITPNDLNDKDATFGYTTFLKLVENYDFDFVLLNHDGRRLGGLMAPLKQLEMTKGFKWLAYMPIDRKFYNQSEIEHYGLMPHIVWYSKYAYDLCMDVDPEQSKRMSWIHCPLDIEEFPIVGKKNILKFQDKYFKGRFNFKQDFIVGWFGRNQFRKNPAQAPEILNELMKEDPSYKLYMHCDLKDWEGKYDLSVQLSEMSFPIDGLAVPQLNAEISGVSQSDLNGAYQSMDVYLSTATGEGFGYGTVEAMACELPMVLPDNTSFRELAGESALYSPPVATQVQYDSANATRQISSTEVFVDQISEIRDNYDTYKKKAKEGREWVMENLNLDHIGQQWKDLLNNL